MFSIEQIALIITVVSNAIVWYLMIRLNKWSKTLELTSLYMNRFNELLKDQEKVGKRGLQPEVWWRLFWNLQQEQYLLWKKGCIDKKFFEIWVDYRTKEWNEDWCVGGKSIRESWSELSGYLLPEFKTFVRDKWNVEAK